MPPRRSSVEKSAAASPPPTADVRIAVFAGPEPFLREMHSRGLIASIEAKNGPVQVARFDGLSAQIADVLDECRSMGLLAERKVVLVDDADQLIKEKEDDAGDAPAAVGRKPRGGPRHFSPRELLERYAAAPTDGVTLILRSGTWRPGKVDKLIEQCGVIVKCDEPSERDAVAFVMKRAKEHLQRAIDAPAAELLVERIGPHVGRLATELEKLHAAAEAGKPIGVDLVRKLVGLSREEEAWEIQRAILSGRPEQALGKLRELIEVSRVDMVPLRWSLADLARKLHSASSVLTARGNPWDAAKAAKLWGRPDDERNRVILDVAGKRRPGVWAALLSEAVEADYRGKSGRGDEVIALEILTLRFARQVAA